MELGGQNICPTTFAPHVWHIRGKFGINLPLLPYLPHHPNRPKVPQIQIDDGRTKVSVLNQSTSLRVNRVVIIAFYFFHLFYFDLLPWQPFNVLCLRDLFSK
jgi:hypothetical protein